MDDELDGLTVTPDQMIYIATKLKEVNSTLRQLSEEGDMPLTMRIAFGGLLAQLEHTLSTLAMLAEVGLRPDEG